MGRKIYTAADHQKAFEIWYKTRNWTSVAQALTANWSTTKRWATHDYPCSWGCPWHNYDELIADRDKALQARKNLIDDGNFDPVSHDLAMRTAISRKTDKTQFASNPAPMLIVRNDVERIQHWEYLWSKVYFHATGLVTTWCEFQGFGDMPSFERDELEGKLRTTLTGGLVATSLEQCIRMLKVIQDQIDGLQGANRKAITSSTPGKKEMTIGELRVLRQKIKATPAAKLKTMVTVIRSEDATPDSCAS